MVGTCAALCTAADVHTLAGCPSFIRNGTFLLLFRLDRAVEKIFLLHSVGYICQNHNARTQWQFFDVELASERAPSCCSIQKIPLFSLSLR